MKFSDVENGTIFTIKETPSYPKLKTSYGYVDMRDEIRKECFSLPFEFRIMTKEEVAKQFSVTVKEIEDWIKALDV